MFFVCNKNYTFGLDGAITAMSQYADVPKGLTDYITTGYIYRE